MPSVNINMSKIKITIDKKTYSFKTDKVTKQLLETIAEQATNKVKIAKYQFTNQSHVIGGACYE